MKREDLEQLDRQQITKVLNFIGEKVANKFNQNIYFGPSAHYHLAFFKDALYWKPDFRNFTNIYSVDVGTEEGNRLFHYFEYGTADKNIQGGGQMITPKNADFLVIQGRNGKWRGKFFRKNEVHGVRPCFILEKTLAWARQNEERLIDEAMFKLRYA